MADLPPKTTDTARRVAKQKEGLPPLITFNIPAGALEGSNPAEEPADWKTRAKRWLQSEDGRGYLASFAMHVVLLLCLSFSYMRAMQKPVQIGAIFGENQGSLDEVGFDHAGEVGPLQIAGGSPQGAGQQTIVSNPVSQELASEAPRVDAGVGETEANQEVEQFKVDNPSDLLQDSSSSGNGKGKGQGKGGFGRGTGKGNGNGDGDKNSGFAMPGKGRVVTKGSFTAWTVPAHPRPRQRYVIVVQIDLPASALAEMPMSKSGSKSAAARGVDFKWKKGELTGTVVGSDNFFQTIEEEGFFIPKARQMIIPVPGGDRFVEDVIRVHSKTLNETQELVITFGGNERKPNQDF